MFSLLVKRRISVAMSLLLSLLHMLGMPAAKATQKVVKKVTAKCELLPSAMWTPALAKQYARAQMQDYKWNRTEFRALSKLWYSESKWRHAAFNKRPDRWSGKHAGGIPQILGLDPATPAPLQIERGLAYIKSRYGKPSIAWAHHRVHGWY